MAFNASKGRFSNWRVLGTETYHSEKTGKDYVSAIFLDEQGYRKQCRIGEGVDPQLVEQAKDRVLDVCVTCIATKDYSFMVFEGFFPAE